MSFRRSGAALLLFPALASLAAMTGCGSTPTSAASGPVQVSFWESHSPANLQGEAIAHLVAQFNHTHPGIVVTVKSTPASSKALAAVLAGDPPVMAEIGHAPQYGYEQLHALVNLGPLIQKSFTPSQIASIWPAVESGSLTPSGQQYMFPVDVKVNEFFYNQNLFRQAGITTPPATWTQMAADAAAIQKKTGAAGLVMRYSRNEWEPIFVSNGGSLLKPGSTTQLNLNTPAMIQTIHFLRTLYHSPGVQVATYNSGLQDFASGKAGILFNTSDGYEMIREDIGNKFPVGAFAVPPGSSGHSANIFQGLSFVIFSHSTAAQQKAAWTFIKWWSQPKQTDYWSSFAGEPPYAGFVANTLPASTLQKYPGLAVSIQELQQPGTFHKLLTASWGEIAHTIQNQMELAITGKESAAAAAQNMQTQAQAFLSGSAKA